MALPVPILAAELQKGIKIVPLEFYLLRRRIRWVGHAARRSLESPARMCLSSRARNPWTLRAPKVTLGLSMGKSLKQVHFSIRGGQNNPRWFRSTQNRRYWRELVKNIAGWFFPFGMRSGSPNAGLASDSTQNPSEPSLSQRTQTPSKIRRCLSVYAQNPSEPFLRIRRYPR